MVRGVLAFILLAIAACSPSPGSPALYQDRSVQNAVADARAFLPVFFEAWQSESETYSDFRVTVIMPTSVHGRDYVELTDIRREFAGFIGKSSGRKEVPFLVADIADWQFKDGAQFRGGFTRRAMFDMTDADIPNLRDRYHEDPLP